MPVLGRGCKRVLLGDERLPLVLGVEIRFGLGDVASAVVCEGKLLFTLSKVRREREVLLVLFDEPCWAVGGSGVWPSLLRRLCTLSTTEKLPSGPVVLFLRLGLLSSSSSPSEDCRFDWEVRR